MRLKENLYFLALLGGFSISFAQAQTLGPADGDAAYKSPTGDQMERVDKGTHITNNTIYQTVGKTMPYYVAPSLLNFPTLDRDKIKYTTAELTSVPPITWTWSTASTNITVSGATNLNKADITVNTQEPGATRGCRELFLRCSGKIVVQTCGDGGAEPIHQRCRACWCCLRGANF